MAYLYPQDEWEQNDLSDPWPMNYYETTFETGTTNRSPIHRGSTIGALPKLPLKLTKATTRSPEQHWYNHSSINSAPSKVGIAKSNNDNSVRQDTETRASKLPCGFAFLGCEYEVPSNSRSDWTSHVLSHIKEVPRLSRSSCHVCFRIFLSEVKDYPKNVWLDRLDHCWQHIHDQETSLSKEDGVKEYLRDGALLDSDGPYQVYRYGQPCGNVFKGLVTLMYGEVLDTSVQPWRPTSMLNRSFKGLTIGEARITKPKFMANLQERDGTFQVPKKVQPQSPLLGPLLSDLNSNAPLQSPIEPAIEAIPELDESRILLPEVTTEILSVANLTLDDHPEPEDDVPDADHEMTMDIQQNTQEATKSENLTPSSSPAASARTSIMESTYSEDETDWDGESSMGSPHDRMSIYAATTHEIREDELLVKQQLTAAQRSVIDRLMNEFWVIFDHRWQPRDRPSGATGSGSPSTASNSNSAFPAPSPASFKPVKRQRSSDDGVSENEGERPSKRKGKEPASADQSDDTLRFACPYRKHNPRKYSVQDWDRCALTPHTSVARVKAHLYKYHSIHQCPRCKNLFDTPSILEAHTLAPDSCSIQTAEQVDGITSKIREQLQCRKKAFSGQTASDRWVQIYKIIFQPESDEDIPSPYFEPVRDIEHNPPLSPESRVFAEYESYLQRELPRHVEQIIKSAVISGMQPLEEKLRQQLTSFMEEAKRRVYSSFRAQYNELQNPSETPAAEGGGNLAEHGATPAEMLETFFQPLPDADVDSMPNMPDENIRLPEPKNDDLNDSAYASGSARAASLPIEDHSSWTNVDASAATQAGPSSSIAQQDDATSQHPELTRGWEASQYLNEFLGNDFVLTEEDLRYNEFTFGDGSWALNLDNIDLDQQNIEGSWNFSST